MKKASRVGMAGVSVGSGSVSLRRRRSGPTVRVLMYHGFGDSRRNPWVVAEPEFEEQMRWLGSRGLAVSLDELVRFARGELDLPDGAALVTMDDGFASVLELAAPIMQRHGVPSVAFVTTSFVGTTNAYGERYLTWDEVAELPKAGVTVGSHAHHHRSIARLDPADARDEVVRSKDLLEDRLGAAVDTFAYPYGMRLDESPATRALLTEAGYQTVFIAQHGTVRPGADLTRLPRVKVEGGDPGWMFPWLCRGAMDGWRLVDDTLWRLQRPDPADAG